MTFCLLLSLVAALHEVAATDKFGILTFSAFPVVFEVLFGFFFAAIFSTDFFCAFTLIVCNKVCSFTGTPTPRDLKNFCFFPVYQRRSQGCSSLSFNSRDWLNSRDRILIEGLA